MQEVTQDKVADTLADRKDNYGVLSITCIYMNEEQR